MQDTDYALDANASALLEGDEATLILNLSESKIYMSKNDEHQQLIFPTIETGENIRYKFVVGFAHQANVGTAVTIKDVEDLTYQD